MKVALIASVVESSTVPVSLSASARAYHVPGSGAFGKFATDDVAAVEPRTADVELHDSGWKLASTLIVTLLGRIEPQIRATSWKTIIRCWPTVVPVFPPTGVAGVVSLKPWPAASFEMTTIVAAAAGRAGSRRAMKRAAAVRRITESPQRSAVFGAGAGVAATAARAASAPWTHEYDSVPSAFLFATA